jgi:hypothetical protein
MEVDTPITTLFSNEVRRKKNSSYLNYDRIVEISRSIQPGEKTVNITCYRGKRHWCCPNPFYAQTCRVAQCGLRMGMYSHTEVITIPEAGLMPESGLWEW